jgi:hypothetical protein
MLSGWDIVDGLPPTPGMGTGRQGAIAERIAPGSTARGGLHCANPPYGLPAIARLPLLLALDATPPPAQRTSISVDGGRSSWNASRKAASEQKEMLMPIEGKKPKEAAAKKTASRPQRKSAWQLRDGVS